MGVKGLGTGGDCSEVLETGAAFAGGSQKSTAMVATGDHVSFGNLGSGLQKNSVPFLSQ